MSDGDGRESRVMVFEIESRIIDEACDRGYDPEGVEVVRARVDEDDLDLVVQIEGSKL